MLKELEPLFVFDLANNHQGSVEHGLNIIRKVCEVTKGFPFKVGFKLQYRDLDTLIHADYKNRTDFKYIKRFMETRLTEAEYKRLKDEMEILGFITVCTPYDEKSVDLVEEHGFDIIKVASASFIDWLLWERIVKTDKPIIASTAGASIEDIDKVVSFLEHRQKDFAMMHCVAEYPTPFDHLELSRIGLLKQRFPQVRIGYSTHETPDNVDAVKVAIGLGATIFEKHVGLAQGDFTINAYSASPQWIREWLESAKQAFEMCQEQGENKKEIMELRNLQRGAFAKDDIEKGQRIATNDMFFALPTFEGQFVANNVSKYAEFYADCDIPARSAITVENATRVDTREKVYSVIKQVRELVSKSGVPVPQKVDVEMSHHYGIDKVAEYGMTIFTIVNREYCKKLLIMLAGQKHPEQYHKEKEETFHLLYGDLAINLDGQVKDCKVGDIVTINKGVKHSFATDSGAVIEEISSTHYKEDSFYSDPAITQNKHRKTQLTYWLD